MAVTSPYQGYVHCVRLVVTIAPASAATTLAYPFLPSQAAAPRDPSHPPEQAMVRTGRCNVGDCGGSDLLICRASRC